VKILLATYWNIPHLGGVWPLMCQIKEKLESLGHEVDLFGNCEDGSGYHIVNKNLVIKKEKLLPLLYTQLNHVNYQILHVDERVFYQEIERYCMELAAVYFGLDNYDIIHTQDVISTRCLSRAKPKQTPLFASIHGVLAGEIIQSHKFSDPEASVEKIKKTSNWKHYWALDKLGTDSADLIHTSSQWTKNSFINEYGVSKDRIVLFQYGINIEEFIKKMDKETEIKKPQNKKVIIFTGRLVQIKGIHFLIHSLFQLKKVRQDWICWIVGEGQMKDHLQKLVADLGLRQYVKFLGSRDDVPALLKISDIFVLPSLQDNMPLSLIEAQISGKAIVVSDAGGLPEMVKHGENGLIAPAGQSEPLFEHLKTLLEDDSYRNMLSSNSKQWALKHWGIDLMTERILTIYKNMIDNVN
jgi:glycosyltransferase involved in cell wall biosynthesis